MAVVDPEFSELKKQVTNLQVEMAELKKTASWWHQFSSTALPIIITIIIAVWAGIVTQSGRFESLERRIERLEQNQLEMNQRLARVEQNQLEMNQRLTQIQETLRRLEQQRR
jgi:prefoldin subunit 5